MSSQRVPRHIRLSSQPIEEPETCSTCWTPGAYDAEHTVLFSSDYPHWD